jgi:ABC-type transporter Mla subunit MlaD
MNGGKLNKFKNYILQEYPIGSWFTKSELNYVDINAYCGTDDYVEIDRLFERLVSENFLTKDVRNWKVCYEINSSKITEKDNKIVEKAKNNSRNKKAQSNEIVAHDFEKEKQQLQEFTKNLLKTSDLPSVRGGNHWYGGSVKATGDDLNNLTQRINDSFIEQHKNIVDIIKKFDSIYDTFEALDKDYIQRILVNLKAVEEVNRKAVRGLEQNKKLFDSQKTIIEVLKKHKDELDNLKHLKEIDEFYNAYTNFEAYQEKNIEELRVSQDNIDTKFLAHQKIYNQFSDKQNTEVAKLQNNQEKIFDELDDLSNTVRIFDKKLENLDGTVKKLEESNSEKIDELKSTSDEGFAKIAKKIKENQNENLAHVKSIHSETENQLNETKEYFQNQLKTTRLLAIILFIAFIVLLVLILSGVI